MVVPCSEVAMSDAEKESEARCKAMLNKLIAEVKRQTVEMEDLAVRMGELAVGLKAVVQPPGAPAHALPPLVPAPTAICVTAVDHAVAAATPCAEDALAPESPTMCSTSGPDPNAGYAKVAAVSLLSRGATTALRAHAEPVNVSSSKSLATGELDALMPTGCPMNRPNDDTDSRTSAFMPDAALGSPSTAALLNVAITNPASSLGAPCVCADTGRIAAHQLFGEMLPRAEDDHALAEATPGTDPAPPLTMVPDANVHLVLVTQLATSTPSGVAAKSAGCGNELNHRCLLCLQDTRKPFDEMPIRSSVVLWPTPEKNVGWSPWPFPYQVQSINHEAEARPMSWPSVGCGREVDQLKHPWPPPLHFLSGVVAEMVFLMMKRVASSLELVELKPWPPPGHISCSVSCSVMGAQGLPTVFLWSGISVGLVASNIGPNSRRVLSCGMRLWQQKRGGVFDLACKVSKQQGACCYEFSCVVLPNDSVLVMAIQACSALGCLVRGTQLHTLVVALGFERKATVWDCLIDMYGKCGDIDSCRMVFETMIDRDQESGFTVDRFTLGSGVAACARLADIGRGRAFHGYLIRRALYTDVIQGSVLIDMYGKGGLMEFSTLHQHLIQLITYVQLGGNGRYALIYGHSVRSTVGMSNIRRIIGVGPQFDILWDTLTAKEHMELFASIKGLPAATIKSVVEQSLAQVKLSQAANVRAGNYSGGMKRRLGNLKEMPQFCIKVGYILTGLNGSDWEKRLELKELQANVVHLSLLSRYYKRAYQELFLSNDAKSAESSSEPNAQQASDYYRFGWLLFLVLRIQTFSRFEDLVTSTNGLVSMLVILTIHIPVRLRNFNIQDSSRFAKKSEKGVNLIASLCERYYTLEDELSKALETTNTLVMDILKKKPCSAASECQKDNLSFIDPEGLTFFENLLEGDSLKSSLLILEKEYENAINTKGELVERMFANDEDSLLGSGSLSGGAIILPGTKRKYDVMASPAKSITSTSVRSTNRMDAIWTEQRKREALKLYYRVLESMCRAESQILSGNNLTSFLSNERFHWCMIACSAELVLAMHKTVTMMLPAVLEKTGITAFDLSKVIEGFMASAWGQAGIQGGRNVMSRLGLLLWAVGHKGERRVSTKGKPQGLQRASKEQTPNCFFLPAAASPRSPFCSSPQIPLI